MSDAQLTKYYSMQDVTDMVAPYIKKSHESIYVTEHDASIFLQKIREGLLKVGEMYATVSYLKGQSDLQRERTEARLRLEEFPGFARENGLIKATEKDKWAFIVSHPEYETAYNESEKWNAISKYLETVRSSFYSCMDEVKKSVYSSTHYNNRSITG